MGKRTKKIIEFDQFITPDGLVYNFHNGSDRFLMSFTGLGMPPINYITQPQLHGDKITGFRLGARTIQYLHRRRACDRRGYWDNRFDIINFLRPNRQLPDPTIFGYQVGELRKILPTGDIRAIKVVIQQGPVFQSRNLDGWEETTFQEVLQFLAPDPTFFDPNINLVEFTLPALEENLAFFDPLNIDLLDNITFDGTFLGGAEANVIFGGGVVNEIQDIIYTGTWLSYPEIVLIGPMKEPKIVNLATGEILELLREIGVGEIVTITLDPGNKTISNNFGENLIGSLSVDSDLVTFHIAPDPEAPGGLNQIQVTFTGGDPGTTAIELTYLTRYIGI